MAIGRRRQPKERSVADAFELEMEESFYEEKVFIAYRHIGGLLYAGGMQEKERC